MKNKIIEIERLLQWLDYHNKNLTKAQMGALETMKINIKDILQEI